MLHACSTPEARHVTRFLEIAHLDAEAIQGDRPDYVLVIDGRRIGLEHQELTEEDLASNAPNFAWLEEALTAELRQRGLAPDVDIGLSVNAAEPVFRKRRYVEELVPKLGALVAERAPVVSARAPLQIASTELALHGIVGPEFVRIARISGLQQGPLVYCSPGFWGPVDSTLVNAIHKKEKPAGLCRGPFPAGGLGRGRPRPGAVTRPASHGVGTVDPCCRPQELASSDRVAPRSGARRCTRSTHRRCTDYT